MPKTHVRKRCITLEDKHFDLYKRKVEIGDTLAVAFRSGNTAELRIGTVTGYSSKKSSWSSGRTPLIEVKWDPEITRYPESSKIEADNGRYVIINRDSPPNN